MRRLLINFGSYCFANVSVRLFIVTSLPPEFWAEAAHLPFRCRDAPRPVFLYDDFEQVDMTKLELIRQSSEAHAADRGVFFELHVVRVNKSEGYYAPLRCSSLMLPYALQEPQTATNYFHFLEDDMDYSVANFLSFKQEDDYWRSLPGDAHIYFAHGFQRYESYAGLEYADRADPLDPPELYDSDQHHATGIWIVGDRIYWTPSITYAAGWFLSRDQIVYLHRHNWLLDVEQGRAMGPDFDPRMEASGWRYWSTFV